MVPPCQNSRRRSRREKETRKSVREAELLGTSDLLRTTAPWTNIVCVMCACVDEMFVRSVQKRSRRAILYREKKKPAPAPSPAAVAEAAAAGDGRAGSGEIRGPAAFAADARC